MAVAKIHQQTVHQLMAKQLIKETAFTQMTASVV
jgi:hypothetical protein